MKSAILLSAILCALVICDMRSADAAHVVVKKSGVQDCETNCSSHFLYNCATSPKGTAPGGYDYCLAELSDCNKECERKYGGKQ